MCDAVQKSDGESSAERKSHFDSTRGRGGRRGRGRRNTYSGGKKKWSEYHYAAGGSREDPLNLRGVDDGIGSDDNTDVKQSDDQPIVVKNKRDPLGLNKISKREEKKRRRERSRSQSPAPGTKLPRRGSSPAPGSSEKKEKSEKEDDKHEPEEKIAQKKSKKEYFNKKYCYGNFDRYYGTRLDRDQKDNRMTMFRKEWFELKTVLDIGCNVGFLTLAIAKEYQPRRILGIDIDEHLIGVARKNIKHYCDKEIEFIGKFPASFCNQFGSISQMPTTFSTKFPDNIWFRKENYVLENDELLETVTEEFDVILALSITKWIHLNFGDDGIRRFFRRAFNQLLPGGRFVLEPQPYSTYKKRANMTETTKENFKQIEFKPEDFEFYLIEVVGFERVEHLGVADAKSKGFSRPVDVYMKKPPGFLTKNADKKEEEEKVLEELEPMDQDQSNGSDDNSATSTPNTI